MPFSRFGRSEPPARGARVGTVYAAISGDAWARDQLAAVHRKLFEVGGARRGRGPDYFLYVQPSRARCEIRELAAWVADRFGSPGARVPATTPFGYLSSRWDGWLTLFAALARGEGNGLRWDFDAAIAPLSWTASAAAPPVRALRALAVRSTIPGERERGEPARSRTVPPAARGRGEEEARLAARDLEEEQRRREEKQEEELEELRAQREFLQQQIAQAKALAARGEGHPSLREGKTGEKLYGERQARERTREAEEREREQERTAPPRSSSALL